MNERIAVIVAHVDDAELWAGGTLLKYSCQAQITVFVLYCDDEVRKKEAHKSAALLHCEYKFLDTNSLYSELALFRPTIIITHWAADSHPEHADVFLQVQKILPNLQILEHVAPNVFCMETYNKLCMPPQQIFCPNRYIDITSLWGKKMELISIFNSQPVYYWKEMVTSLNQLSGRQVGVDYAESFIQIPVLGVMRWCDDLLKGNSL